MSYSNSGRSENSLSFDPYQEKVANAVFMVNKLVKNDKHFIRKTPAEFRSQVRELKTTQNFEQDTGKDEILDDLLRQYLTPEYEKMIRQKLNQKPASPVTPPKKTPPKKTRRVSSSKMTVIVGKNKKSKKSKKKSKRNNKRKPSKKK